jgi:hypothetical protein
MEEIVIKLSPQEIEKCLKEVSVRLQRALYVYEQSLINDNYNFKSYVYSIMLYINSCNSLCDYDLTNVIVNVNTLYMHKELNKKMVKKIIMESKHIVADIKKKWSDNLG